MLGTQPVFDDIARNSSHRISCQFPTYLQEKKFIQHRKRKDGIDLKNMRKIVDFDAHPPIPVHGPFVCLRMLLCCLSLAWNLRVGPSFDAKSFPGLSHSLSARSSAFLTARPSFFSSNPQISSFFSVSSPPARCNQFSRHQSSEYKGSRSWLRSGACPG